jgi:hypothetical protein
MESAAAAATAMKPTATVESTAIVEPASEASAIKPAASAKAVSPAHKATAVIAATVESGPAIEAAVPVVAVEPGASANENAADKPVRAVVAVRRTGVGVIVIVAVGADGRWAVVTGAHSHADKNPLGVGE